MSLHSRMALALWSLPSLVAYSHIDGRTTGPRGGLLIKNTVTCATDRVEYASIWETRATDSTSTLCRGYPKAVRVRTSSLCPSLETRPQPGKNREPYPQTQHTISHSERDSSESQSQRLTSVDDWGHRGKKVVRGSVRGSVSPGAMQGTTSA